MENTELTLSENGYQVIITNIKYGGNVINNKIKEKPELAVLDIPEGILKNKNDNQKFMDNVESFCYNTLSRKYGREISYCQIWLP